MSVPPRKRISFDESPSPIEQSPPAAAFQVPPAQPEGTDAKAPVRHSTRVGKRGVQLWLSPQAYRQLRLIAAKEDLQIQDCLAEGLDMFFQSRGEHRIARKQD
jgi:hypothetical protein